MAGLGALLFSARIKDPDGPLVVGFGAGESLVVTEKNATLLFNTQLPPGLSTYPAYRLPWHPAS